MTAAAVYLVLSQLLSVTEPTSNDSILDLFITNIVQLHAKIKTFIPFLLVAWGYLNDIDEKIKSDMFLFADDVVLINKLNNLKTLENQMNSDLNKWNAFTCES